MLAMFALTLSATQNTVYHCLTKSSVLEEISALTVD